MGFVPTLSENAHAARRSSLRNWPRTDAVRAPRLLPRVDFVCARLPDTRAISGRFERLLERFDLTFVLGCLRALALRLRFDCDLPADADRRDVDRLEVAFLRDLPEVALDPEDRLLAVDVRERLALERPVPEREALDRLRTEAPLRERVEPEREDERFADVRLPELRREDAARFCEPRREEDEPERALVRPRPRRPDEACSAVSREISLVKLLFCPRAVVS